MQREIRVSGLTGGKVLVFCCCFFVLGDLAINIEMEGRNT